MRRKKRKSKALPKGCDSHLEADLKKGGLRGCEWKPDRIPYTIEKNYNPDCVYGDIIIEVKGRFRTSDEAAKYVWLRKALPEEKELVFVFASPNCKMPNAKRRKDGTFNTHKAWAEKNGFRWYDKNHLPPEWGKKK